MASAGTRRTQCLSFEARAGADAVPVHACLAVGVALVSGHQGDAVGSRASERERELVLMLLRVDGFDDAGAHGELVERALFTRRPPVRAPEDQRVLGADSTRLRRASS